MALIPTFQTFIRWWGEGLYNGLPNAARKLFRTALPRLVLHTHDGHSVDVQWSQDGKSQMRGQFALQGGNTQHSDLLPAAANGKPYEVELCLGKSQVLALQHHFPEAVKENLQQVLSYQLDRLTPFTADSALFDARVAQHDKGRKEILADIFVVPKHVVERFNRLLADIGVEPVRVVSVAGPIKALISPLAKILRIHKVGRGFRCTLFWGHWCSRWRCHWVINTAGWIRLKPP
ncbi:hypothetical protein [Thiothrix subterranea]|uniref:hypothetical protein n=1 Tax=Thiothrix subterranea TaxID=2735563 RepID=UPI00280BFFB6|nr:hypothetical protein [Thiothrix subterranea]